MALILPIGTEERKMESIGLWKSKKGVIMLKNTLVFTCLVFSMAAITANATIINYTDSGWFDSTGFSTSNSFSNYVAGTWEYDPSDHNLPGDPYNVETRNFFVFDLTNVVGTVTSATLRLDSAATWAATYSVFDVVSPITALRRAPPQFPSEPLKPAVYDDLGEGIEYGSTPLSNTNLQNPTYIDIVLNEAALASINAKDGCTPGDSQDCLWAIGGRYESLFPLFAFGNSGLGVRQLIYATSPVPEPTTMLLFGTGLIGLAGVSRRRRKK